MLNEGTHSISFFTLVVKSINKFFINSHKFFILDSLRHISFNEKNPWKSGDLRSPVENKLYHLEFSIGRSLTIIPKAISATLIAKNRSSDPEIFCKPATLLKKRFWHRCFLVNFAKFLKTPFFIEHLWWLLLKEVIRIVFFMRVHQILLDLRLSILAVVLVTTHSGSC